MLLGLPQGPYPLPLNIQVNIEQLFSTTCLYIVVYLDIYLQQEPSAMPCYPCCAASKELWFTSDLVKAPLPESAL